MTVSVCMITYNHDKYIADAIESVLMQVTSFPVELIIGEDHSSDRTRIICEEYSTRYPDKIRLLPSGRNVGMMQNFIRTLEACKGTYISFIEGDDFWTDPLKLQKQVDFLEHNKGYSACFHNVILRNTRNNQESERVFHPEELQETYETEDLLRQWFIPSASLVFVNYDDFRLPDWFPFCKSGDIPFLLLLSLKGKIRYIREIMGVYRLHDTGVSASHVGYDKIIAMVFIYENFNIYSGFRFKKAIREALIFEIEYHLRKPEDLDLHRSRHSKYALSRVWRVIKNRFLSSLKKISTQKGFI